MEEKDVIVETPNDTVEETVETPATETTEETIETEPEVDVEQLQATNKKLYERAKKAEAELKASKASKPATAPASQLDPVEAALLVNGMSEELLTELKAVAKVRNISLIKAQADPIFVAVKDKFEKDKKTEQASMPASRGSGSVKVKKTFATPGLTREEHKALVQGL